MLCDTSCYDLAEAFLRDDIRNKTQLHINSVELGERIQQTIEDYLADVAKARDLTTEMVYQHKKPESL